MKILKIRKMWADWQDKIDPDIRISRRIFWDIDLTDFDWKEYKTLVVQRVIEWGTYNDFYAMFEIYGGPDKVREIIKEIPHFNNPRDISFVCAAFNLDREELKCCTRKQ